MTSALHPLAIDHRFLGKTAEQITSILLGDDCARRQDMDQAEAHYAAAGVSVSSEQYLVWAADAEQQGWQGSAHELYRMARSTGDPMIMGRATEALRRLCVEAGNLFRLEQEFRNPTDAELRAIAVCHLRERAVFMGQEERFAMLERIAYLLRDRKLLWAAFRLAIREGAWVAFETIAGSLGHVPTRRERLALGRVLIRRGWGTDRRRVLTYLQTHQLRELYGCALIDHCTSHDWTTTRAWARKLGHCFTEAELLAIKAEYTRHHCHVIPILAELARRFPKRWRREFREELRESRARALQHGDVRSAEWIARIARKPLTLAECRTLLDKTMPLHSGSCERESREIAERLVREAAERFAKRCARTSRQPPQHLVAAG
ncbi:hypothetical protein HY632_04930 [Candidatus Uhrbacteria bacterium]|nr:hypothetical protein [Candidatus Uhrbacteria bacterium]